MRNADMPTVPIFDDCGRPAMYGADGVEALGLTKREMIAMHMMQGILAAGNADEFVVGDEVGFAGFAIAATDALLAELERTK